MVTELKNSFDIFLPTRVSKLLMKDETVLKKLEEQMKSRDVYLKHLGSGFTLSSEICLLFAKSHELCNNIDLRVTISNLSQYCFNAILECPLALEPCCFRPICRRHTIPQL
ncbi:hypothetical protein TSAR_000694 [Trichomalopsis sarcophagae]|uniref:Uncharacterized protein n=1 Tax=Trichomalopsis sarcophagae TaxID=543379 RepID=A0A232EUE0_9HYME|nr:hypothetical protein TSAR_000694 [Trichomalopsis sarcophagae]